VLIKHPPYLDLLPFPVLRDRAITLGSAAPKLFDPWELKRDIFMEKVVFKKERSWDAGSWEARPWFVRKWRLLTG
jgi:hypothetical protein